MKNHFLLLMVFLTFNIFAQKTILNFEEGYSVEILESNGEQARKGDVYLGVFKMEGTHYLGGSYHIPKKANFNIAIAPNNIQVDGSIFGLSWHKKTNTRTTIATYGTSYNKVVREKVKLPLNKFRSLGLHAGYNNFSFKSLEETFKGNSVILGITYLKSTRLKANIFNNNKFFRQINGSSTTKLNVDYVRYFDSDVINSSDKISVANPESFIRDTGVRMYFDGSLTFFSRKKERLSFRYMLGAIRGIKKRKDVGLIFGLGFGYSFL